MFLATTPPKLPPNDALTPPPSGSKTSSPVHTALNLIRKLYSGGGVSCGPWKSIELPASGYEEFDKAVNADSLLRSFVKNKVRLDYDENREKLTLRMPSTVHETFIELVVEDILLQLRTLSSSSAPSGNFAQRIRPLGSSRITFKKNVKLDSASTTQTAETAETYIRHDPDASFAHESAKYPGVVIEVSYSQKRGCLNHLADNYILESNGNIRVVVGLDVDYRSSKKATLSMWCPKIISNEQDGQPELVAETLIESQVFRNEDGTTNEATSLSIPLDSFAPNKISSEYLFNDEEIILSSQTLCQYLGTAEGRSLAEKEGVEDSPPLRLRKRRRLKTPPEQLDSEDEAAFFAQEKDATDRADREDNSFKASSSQGSR